MAMRMRVHVPALISAAGGVWAMTFLGLYGFGWNDYLSEVMPSYDALTSGHLWRFLSLAPGYGGSLELRAPFALVPGLWGGGQVAVYRAVSIPCLIAAALLSVWIVGRLREGGSGRLARATVLGLIVVNPVTLYALQVGHAEELLGGVLCVAAVLAAQRERAGWAGLLLGLAIVNKQWALVAVGPVLLALPGGRLRATLVTGAVAAAFYAPLLAAQYLGSTTPSGGPAALATGSGAIFQPWQLWWFLGAHGHVVKDAFGVVKVGYRTPPSWIGSLPHLLVVALSVPATLLAARRGRRDAMLLLALVLAIRFALDSWDTVYYPLPFLVALTTWEAFHRRRPPVLSLLASVVVWLVFIVLPQRLSADAQSAAFLVAAVPALVALAVAVIAPQAPERWRALVRRSSSDQRAAPIPTV